LKVLGYKCVIKDTNNTSLGQIKCVVSLVTECVSWDSKGLYISAFGFAKVDTLTISVKRSSIASKAHLIRMSGTTCL
jgi:hypothetical protein